MLNKLTLALALGLTTALPVWAQDSGPLRIEITDGVIPTARLSGPGLGYGDDPALV